MAGLLTAATVVAGLTAVSFRWNTAPALPVPPLVNEAAIQSIPLNLSIRRGDTLDEILGRAGIDQATKLEVITALRDAFDVRKFRAGTQLTLVRQIAGELESLEYIIDPDHKLQISKSEGSFAASVIDIPGIVHEVSIRGSLEGSLFESMERTGESPELAIQMAEIFAWDLDFYTDPQPGDEFCLLVEKKEYLNGQPPTYKRILAAKYVNEGTPYDAFLFPDKDGEPQYYSPDGRSLRAAFLRSPLKFEARISSHFSHSRRHPILKINRPHLGTDYAAPTGTPVQSLAPGRVTFSGRSGGAGNLVKVQHANGFETQYMHLSRRFVKKGQKVSQGQRIGAVGATGLATGPHLDFRIRKNGKYMNFERFKPPRATRIAAAQMDTFNETKTRYAAMMLPGLQHGPVLASDTPPAKTSTLD